MNIDKLIKKLKADLKNAMMSRDTVAVKTIRCLISDIDNAGAVKVEQPEVMLMSGGIAGATSGIGSSEVPRKELFAKDIVEIIQKQIAEINESISLTKEQSGFDISEYERQIEILENYLEFIEKENLAGI
ncbi:hypothetical protein M0R01_00760 [bacterium]|nr:hypothetical protein [bacterium]